MYKPHIIVIALALDPRRGSEPGKGWWWATALSRFFHLHVVTREENLAACRETLAGEASDWSFHPTDTSFENCPTTLSYYVRYHKWLREALGIAEEIKNRHPVRGLFHLTLGSFRVLPRYDRLGIPYVVGPLGGGECAPRAFLRNRSAPLTHRLSESVRPLANGVFALVPGLRRTLRRAALTLATSEESADVLRLMGAQHTVAVFPDAYDDWIDTAAVLENRSQQQAAVGQTIRLLWQGRALWWKCPDLALDLLAKAHAEGVRVELTMVGDWSGPVGVSIQHQAARLGLLSHVRFLAGMPRHEFLDVQASHHGFLATSLHDSGGIPLLEAQARGLPCLTLGLGGNRESACPDAGVPAGGAGPDDFITRSVRCLRRWQDDPGQWLAEARAALHFSTTFTNARLQACVREHVVPVFAADAAGG